MKKSAQVVMLPTNEKANIVLKKNNELVILPTGHIGTNPSKLTQPQHLYILSDEEIKEGDWFIMNSCIVRQCSLHKGDILDTIGGLHHESVCKKIIATTDSSLVYNHKELHEVQAVIMESSYHKSLPQPSQDFLKVFVEEYNKGNVITEVMVEYEEIQVLKQTLNEGFGSYYHKAESEFVLKVNPTDNTITIRKAKDSWSREEVIELIQKYSKECTGWSWFETDEKWIEENL